MGKEKNPANKTKTVNIILICALVVAFIIVFAVGFIVANVKDGFVIRIEGAVATGGSKTSTSTDIIDSTDEPSSDEPVTNEIGEVVTDASGEAVTEVVTPATEAPGNPGTPAASSVDLSTPQKILDYYAKAIHYASDDGKGLRAGFKVKRSATAIKSPDWGAIGEIKKKGEPVKDLFDKFVGLKPYSAEFKKGEAHKERKYVALADSTLTLNDIKSASYKKSGNDYILTINVKDGNSYCKSTGKIAEATNNSPIEKCGMCASTNDFDHVHHKNAANIVNTGSGLITNVTDSTKDCVVIATVDGQTGKIKNLKVNFTASADLDFLGGTKSAILKTNVEYYDFKY